MNPHHHWSNPLALHMKRPRPNQVDTEAKLRCKHREAASCSVFFPLCHLISLVLPGCSWAEDLETQAPDLASHPELKDNDSDFPFSMPSGTTNGCHLIFKYSEKPTPLQCTGQMSHPSLRLGQVQMA